MAESITLLNQPLIEERAQQCGERIGLVSCLHPSLDLQTVRSESAEALTCLVEKILRHGDVNERRMDIAVPQIGREERQLVLRIDAGAITFENAVHHER